MRTETRIFIAVLEGDLDETKRLEATLTPEERHAAGTAVTQMWNVLVQV